MATQLWKSPRISSWLTYPEDVWEGPEPTWPPRLFAAGADRRQLHLDMRFGPCPSRIGPRSIFQLVLSRSSTTALATLCCSSSVHTQPQIVGLAPQATRMERKENIVKRVKLAVGHLGSAGSGLPGVEARGPPSAGPSVCRACGVTCGGSLQRCGGSVSASASASFGPVPRRPLGTSPRRPVIRAVGRVVPRPHAQPGDDRGRAHGC